MNSYKSLYGKKPSASVMLSDLLNDQPITKPLYKKSSCTEPSNGVIITNKNSEKDCRPKAKVLWTCDDEEFIEAFKYAVGDVDLDTNP